jgi:hypothetical protein
MTTKRQEFLSEVGDLFRSRMGFYFSRNGDEISFINALLKVPPYEAAITDEWINTYHDAIKKTGEFREAITSQLIDFTLTDVNLNVDHEIVYHIYTKFNTGIKSIDQFEGDILVGKNSQEFEFSPYNDNILRSVTGEEWDAATIAIKGEMVFGGIKKLHN